MPCFICLGNEFIAMKRMACCKKYCHQLCLQKWITYNKYCKYANVILCPCCRTNIRNNLFVPLELYNMPLSFYVQYEKEVNGSTAYDTVYVDSDEDDDDDNFE